MPTSLIYAKIRASMWEKDPHCEECGQVTILPSKLTGADGITPPSTMATIEHRYSKYHPDRRTHSDRAYQLLCRGCNQQRAQKEFRQLPSPIKKLLSRSVSAQDAIKQVLEKMPDHPEIVKWLEIVRQ